MLQGSQVNISANSVVSPSRAASAHEGGARRDRAGGNRPRPGASGARIMAPITCFLPHSTMAPLKRKRALPAAEESDSDSGYSVVAAQDDEDDSMDISSALVGKKPRLEEDEGNDDDLQDFIQASIAKRNIKGGTEVVKKVKGKSKITKGEVGGGSFQSMGKLSSRCFQNTY